MRPMRRSPATTPKGARSSPGSGWRIGDHRREVRLGGELAVDAGAARELADARALLDEFDLQPQQDSRLDRRSKFRALDGHEIDELPRPGEAERFDGKDA